MTDTTSKPADATPAQERTMLEVIAEAREAGIKLGDQILRAPATSPVPTPKGGEVHPYLKLYGIKGDAADATINKEFAQDDAIVRGFEKAFAKQRERVEVAKAKRRAQLAAQS